MPRAAIGLFEAEKDIGHVGKPGSARYDAQTQAYTVTGGGENMWFTNDALHYVYTQASGDVSLAADVTWPAKAATRIGKRV